RSSDLALARRDSEVRPRDPADEEGIARQDCVVRDEAAVLGAVPRRVQDAKPERTDRDLAAVGEWLERVVRRRRGVDADARAVLEGEPAVTGDVVGVRVRL